MTIATASRLTGEERRSLYSSDMVSRVILGMQDFRLKLKERFDALEKGEETVLQRRGRPIGALVPMDDYRKIRELRGDPTDL